MNTQNGSQILAAFVVGVAVIFLLGVITKNDIRYMGGHVSSGTGAEEMDEETLKSKETDTALLNVKDQQPGGSVVVAHVEVSESGWVVVHETEAGHVLNALGASRVDAGNHTDVAVELLRMTEPGGSYAVILYTDNGNKEFEIRGDLPMIDMAGNPVMQSFKAFGGGSAR